MVAGVFSVVVMAIASLNGYLSKQQSQTSSLIQLGVFQANLATLVRTNSSWARTIAKNPGMDCLNRRQPCVDGAGKPIQNQPFAIYDASSSNTPYYDASNSANGISTLGVACQGFSQTGSNCPLRYDLKWSAMGTGVDPQVSVSAQLLVEPTSKMVLNAVTYSVPVIIRAAQ